MTKSDIIYYAVTFGTMLQLITEKGEKIMKNIKTKLILSMGSLALVICVGLGLVSFVNGSNALEKTLYKTLPEIAEQTASSVQGRIEEKINAVEDFAARPEIRDINIPWENKRAALLDEIKTNRSTVWLLWIKMGFVSIQMEDTKNVSDRVFFKKALEGKSNVSDPIISRADGKLVVVYAVPIKNNNEIVGVLFQTKDGEDLTGFS